MAIRRFTNIGGIATDHGGTARAARSTPRASWTLRRSYCLRGAVGEPHTRRYAFQERFTLLTTRWTATLEDNRNAMHALICAIAHSTNALRLALLPGAAAAAAHHDANPWP